MQPTKSFEELFHETRPGFFRMIRRDLRCLKYLGMLVLMNLTVGRKVQKKYLTCKASGEPFWLDQGNE